MGRKVSTAILIITEWVGAIPSLIIILISGEPKVAYMVSMGREEKGMDFVHDPFLVSRFSSVTSSIVGLNLKNRYLKTLHHFRHTVESRKR